MNRDIIIFDTTLRDGEQALQASLSVQDKLQIAFALERLGVDIIEAGFPVSSPGDFTSVQTIAREIKNSRICALARCVEKDIDAAANALSVADQSRIHVFLATSTLHVEQKLRTTFDDVLERAISSIKYARKFTDDVEFSCEDAGRTPIDNLCRIVESAIQAGATTINIPDTVGYTIPNEFGGIISTLFERVPNIDHAIISVHCHNDLGLSVANSIAAIQNGARQIECTMNGLGERAGNCSLEEVVMAIKVREQFLHAKTRINHKEIYRTSQIVSQLTNTPISTNKPIIGSNAFSHSSGIHQDGVLKNRSTYEIMTAETIGLPTTQLNLTSRSGRAAVKHRMSLLGYHDNDYDLDKLYAAFLALADKKGQLFDYDLESLVYMSYLDNQHDHYQLKSFNVQSGTTIPSTASITLQIGDDTKIESGVGNGPVDAIYEAINKVISTPIKVKKYQLSSKGQGEDALGQVDIVVEYHARRFHGTGIATDIIEASAKAFVYALNCVWRAQQIEEQKQLQLSDSNAK